MRKATDLFPRGAADPLATRLALHRRLLAEAKRALPSYLRNACLTCWLDRRGQAVLQVATQEYAAQIRFFLPALLEAVKKIVGESVSEVRIRAAIPQAPAASAEAPVSPAAARLIEAEARACVVPEIREALNRLAASLANRRSKDHVKQ